MVFTKILTSRVAAWIVSALEVLAPFSTQSTIVRLEGSIPLYMSEIAAASPVGPNLSRTSQQNWTGRVSRYVSFYLLLRR